MKKRILAMVLALTMIGVLTACGGSDKNKESKKEAGTKEEKVETEILQENGHKFYQLTVEVPKDKGYEFIEELPEEAPYQPEDVFTVLKGENFYIAFSDSSYVYNTALAWIEKYGETEANYEDYKTYIKEGINGVTGEIVEVNGEEMPQQNVTDFAIRRSFNTDGLRDDGINTLFAANLMTADESGDINALLENEEVMAILESEKIEKK
jgi:maltose-binding protein MalE